MKEHHSLISTSLLRRKSRGILQFYILETRVDAALQGLYLSPKPRRHNRSTSHPLPLLLSNLREKLSHLISITSRHTPLVTLFQRSRSPLRKDKSMVIDIKPLGFPIPNLTTQSIWDILLRHTRAKLKISTPTLAIFLRLGHGFKEKRLLKRSKWG